VALRAFLESVFDKPEILEMDEIKSDVFTFSFLLACFICFFPLMGLIEEGHGEDHHARLHVPKWTTSLVANDDDHFLKEEYPI
jgi:hypothetical protein